jgi:hypothetical protein
MKPRWDLLPFSAIQEAVKAMTIGSTTKGGEHAWKELAGDEARERYFSSAMRHVVAWRLGEEIDDESGLHPLSHALADLAILLAIELRVTTMTD